ncbi:hypothetical protein EC973_006313 [Apophysomyces ossiformis]|uniref:CCHC-type domain-containing protein n=1 Tax=Apophysomyces ossiformis TaxID=679940 RepID=A0A8H7BJQ7_9FUNG|nr:hypothetical protein EC973_006313 [Apophysomyces ossiformis]
MHTEWWRQLESLRQGDQTIVDVAEKQQELFQQLCMKDERQKEAVAIARREESLRTKYQDRDDTLELKDMASFSSVSTNASDQKLDALSLNSFDRALNEMNEKFNRLEINLMERLNRHQGYSSNNYPPGGPTCFNCHERSHKSFACPNKERHESSGNGIGQQ